MSDGAGVDGGYVDGRSGWLFEGLFQVNDFCHRE